MNVFLFCRLFDLTLAFVDGGSTGRDDPIYEAHGAPIGKWAEAMKYRWLLEAAMQTLFATAVDVLAKTKKIWANVSKLQLQRLWFWLGG